MGQYEPAFYTVIRTDGSRIAAQRITDRREVYREAGHLKIVNPLIRDNTNIERDGRAEEPTLEDWREKILLKANSQSVQEKIITNTEESAETSSSDKMRTNHQRSHQLLTRPRRDRRRVEYVKDYVT